MILQTFNGKVGLFTQNTTIAKTKIIELERQLLKDQLALRKLEGQLPGNYRNGVFRGNYTQIMKKASPAAEDYARDRMFNNTGTTDTFVASQQKIIDKLKTTTSVFNTAKSAANSFVSVLGNMFIMAGVSIALKFVTDSISNFINEQKNSAAAAQEVIDNYNQLKDEAESNKKNIDSLSSRYVELSKGVDIFNNRVSLTTEEYNEYHDIVNQIVDMFPELVNGYNDQGLAILSTKDNIDQLTEAYKRQKRAANDTIIEGGKDVMKGVHNALEGTATSNGIKDKLAPLNAIQENFDDDTALREILLDIRQGNVGGKFNYNELKEGQDFLSKIGVPSIMNIDDVVEHLKQNRPKLTQELHAINNSINSEITKAEALAQGYLENFYSYEELDENSKSFLSAVVNSMDLSLVDNFGKDDVALGDWVNSIITSFEDANLQDVITKLLENDLGTNKISMDIMRKTFSDISKELNLSDEMRVNLELGFNYNFAEFDHIYNNALNNIRDSPTNMIDRISYQFSLFNPESNETDIISYLNQLNKDDLDIVARLSLEGPVTITELMQAIQAVKDAELMDIDSFDMDFLKDKQNEIDNFQSSVDRLQSAYHTLKSGNYTPTELIDSIQAISQLFNNTDLELDFSSISSIDEFADKISELSDEYIDEMIKKLQVNPDSDFGKMLKILYEEAMKGSDAIGRINEEIDSLQGTYDTLANAVDEYNSQGYLSLDTLQAILSMDSEYLAALTYQDGVLALNTEAYAQLIDAKLGVAEATVIEQMMAELAGEANQNLVGDNQVLGASIDETSNKLETLAGKYDNVFAAATTAGLAQQLAHAIETSPLDKEAQGAILDNGEVSLGLINSTRNNIINSLNRSRKASGGSSGKSAASSAAAKEDTEFDWIEKKAQRAQERVKELQESIEQLQNAAAKNNKSQEILEEQQKSLEAYTKSYEEYMARANALNLSPSYIEKIQTGSLEIETVKDGAVAEKVKKYIELYEKALKAKNEITSLNKEIHELTKARLDNIINDFDRLNKLVQAYSDYQEALISLKEKQGSPLLNSDYDTLILKQNEIQRNLKQKYEDLNAEFNNLINSGKIAKYSDDWYEYQEILININKEIVECSSSIEDFKASIVELRFKPFENMNQELENLQSEISDMLSLMGDTGLYENGMLTDKGITSLALYAQQLQKSRQSVVNYNEAMAAYRNMLQNGNISLDQYNEKMAELQSAQRAAALSAKEAREAMISLQKEGIQAQIDDMRKLVESKKEALNAEKELNDYKKSVDEKQKNIQNLQNKINILSNSQSREDIAQRLELEKQLSDAQKALDDEVYNHSITSQQDALDQQLKDYETAKEKELNDLDNNLAAQDAAIEQFLQDITENYDLVYSNLSEYAEIYGLTLTEQLTSPWESAAEAAQLYQDIVGQINANIGLDSSKIDDKDLGTTDGSWKKNETGWWYENADGSYTSNNWQKINGEWYRFDNSGYMQTGWYQDQDGNWYYLSQEQGANEGKMQRNKTTPDGYYVGSDGAWIQDHQKQTQSGSGSSSASTDGSASAGAAGLVSAIAENIKQGQSGENVRKLQQALQQLGYSLNVDGIFGPNTLAAVRQFQSARGIAADGIVGKKTKEQFQLAGFATGGILNGLVKANGDDALITAKKGETILTEQFTDILPNAISAMNALTAMYHPSGKVIPFDRGTSTALNFNQPLVQIDGGLDVSMKKWVGDKIESIPGDIMKELRKHGI